MESDDKVIATRGGWCVGQRTESAGWASWNIETSLQLNLQFVSKHGVIATSSPQYLDSVFMRRPNAHKPRFIYSHFVFDNISSA